MEKVVLENVVDIRTGQHYSVAIVPKRLVKYFIPVNEEESSE